MKIPNPYFENVPNYGNLSVEEVFYEDGYLILFVLKSEKGQRFLAYCCEIRNEQRWILSQVSNQDLIDLIHNKVSVYNILTNTMEHIVVVRNYETRTESFKPILTHDLDELDLHAKEEFLDVDIEDYETYLSKLETTTPYITLVSYSAIWTVSYHIQKSIQFINPSSSFDKSDSLIETNTALYKGESVYVPNC